MKEILFGTGLVLLVLNSIMAVMSKLQIGSFRLQMVYGSSLSFWLIAAGVGLVIMVVGVIQSSD